MTIGNKMTKVSTVKTGSDGPNRVARCDDEGRLEVVITGQTSGGTTSVLASFSGSLTTGGVAQTASAANANRIGYLIRNNSSGSLYVSTLAAAVIGQASLEIKPGELYETPSTMKPTGAISIIGATTGQTWTGREW